MKIIIFLLVNILVVHYQCYSAERVYKISFGACGNQIDLEVVNDSELVLKNSQIEILEKPEWVNFTVENQIMDEIKANQSRSINFIFDIDYSAEILKERRLKFRLLKNKYSCIKEIKIEVLPPDNFELYQNYPNPFNPSTTISYTIPSNGLSTTDLPYVKLQIFDILGRVVSTLVNQTQKPGYYKYVWNANELASGTYIYQVSIKGNNSEGKYLRKKMMVLK